MNEKRLASVGTVIVFAFVLLAEFLPAQSNGPHSSTPTVEKKAEEQFKNIQVLKGIPADQLFPTMQFVTASLGVECDFCHVKGAFEKDDKKQKQTARKMMEMMFAINKNNFDDHRAVTCYSCHRGKTSPVAIPAVMVEEVTPVGDDRDKTAPVSEASAPTTDQVIDKYLQAIGGPATDKVASRVMKGMIDFGGKSFPIDIYSKDPGKRVSFTHMPEGDNVTAFNGKEGWLGMTGHPIREMHGSDLDAAAIDADLHFATHLRRIFSKLELQGSEKIGDRETYKVVGERETKPPVYLYFDQQTGYLLRLVRYGETALGRLPTQIDYADYREQAGTKIPYRWTLARPSGRFTIQLNDVKDNETVDDAKFVKPAAPPEPSKGPAK